MRRCGRKSCGEKFERKREAGSEWGFASVRTGAWLRVRALLDLLAALAAGVDLGVRLLICRVKEIVQIRFVYPPREWLSDLNSVCLRLNTVHFPIGEYQACGWSSRAERRPRWSLVLGGGDWRRKSEPRASRLRRRIRKNPEYRSCCCTEKLRLWWPKKQNRMPENCHWTEVGRLHYIYIYTRIVLVRIVS